MSRKISWQSTACGCSAVIDVDTEEHEIICRPCSPEHTTSVNWKGVENHYCETVAHDVLPRKLAEMSKPWRDDIAKLKEMLLWKTGIFMRSAFQFAPNGLKAFQCFWDNEGKGVTLPDELEEPELLADLVQAKANREFIIDEWLDTYWGAFDQNGEIRSKREEYPIWPEEYFAFSGMTEKIFRTLFHRDPNPEIIEALKGSETEAQCLIMRHGY